MNEPLVRFDDVDFAYGPDRPVLAGCSFCLEPGERLALVGANGSGKTTLLHLVVGLLRPAGGRIEAFGVAAAPPRPISTRSAAASGCCSRTPTTSCSAPPWPRTWPSAR